MKQQKKEYRMVMASDANFMGKADRLTWEYVLNDYASQGWVVVSANNLSFSKTSALAELVVLMERDK